MRLFIFFLLTYCLSNIASYAENFYLPRHIGFSDSLFQTSGLGTSASATPLAGESNWESWLNPSTVESSYGENYRRFFVDVLTNPEPYIAILQEMGVTAHRFSLEWSVIEPSQGVYDEEAIFLYRRFIAKLRNAGIEPYVTLHHFVHPQWFEDLGGFTQEKNIEIFVNHTCHMIDVFPEVQYWITYNEPGIYAFKGFVQGAYPPGRTNDLYCAGHVLRNILMAHCSAYTRIKRKYKGRKQVGIAHKWLKFKPLEDSPLKKGLCFFLTKITHFSIFEFFKTGKFSFFIPYLSDLEFSVPKEEFEKNGGYLDYIGLQFQGFPKIKAGWNCSAHYPGYIWKNFHVCGSGIMLGVSCPVGGKIGSFGIDFCPESIEEALLEAEELHIPIAITDIGFDAKVQKWGQDHFVKDDSIQRQFFEKVLPILHSFQSRTNQLQALFIGTLLRGRLEWDQGNTPSLGVISIDRQTKIIEGEAIQQITHPQWSLAAKYLQQVFQEKNL